MAKEMQAMSLNSKNFILKHKKTIVTNNETTLHQRQMFLKIARKKNWTLKK